MIAAAARFVRMLTLSSILFVTASSDARGCSIPVFRFALESWEPDLYEVVIFYKDALSEEARGAVDFLQASTSDEIRAANVKVSMVDLSSASNQEGRMVVRYPASTDRDQAFWSGLVSQAGVRALLDSPKRREIARRLVKGESAIWVLLESGNEARDDAAAKLLQTQLKEMERLLAWPLSDPESGEEPENQMPPLQISFSFLRVSRKDPAEAFFVSMLLGLELKLKKTTGPIAFPVFGRGRCLDALAGEDLTWEVIREACAFLAGSCTCQFKYMNPGMDLLMSVTWDSLIEENYVLDEALPPLAGMSSFVSPEQATSAGWPLPAASQGDPGEEKSPNGLLVRNLAILVLAGCLAVAVALRVIKRRKRSVP